MAYKVTYAKNAASTLPLFKKHLNLIEVGLKGMEWALSRQPFQFGKIGGSVRGMPLGPFVHAVDGRQYTVSVYFKIVDENEVEVLWFESRPIGQ